MAKLIYGKLCDMLADPNGGQDVITFHLGSPPVRAVSRTRLRDTLNRAGILVPVEDEADRKRVTPRTALRLIELLPT